MENGILLDTTSRTGMSGKFMALVEDERSDEFRTLWTKRSGLRRKQVEIEQRLLKVNDLDWLLQFENRCRKKGQDFSSSLGRVAKRLEISKAVIEKELSETHEIIDKVQPGLGESTFSLVPKSVESGRRLIPQHRLPTVAARNAIIQRYRSKSALETCRALDSQDIDIPVPTSWTERFHGITAWSQAYEDPKCQNLVHKLISTERAHRRHIP